MRIIAKRTLREFWLQPGRQDSKSPLEAWHAEVSSSRWTTPQAIKSQFRNASFLRGNRVVFDIAGNKYRLIVTIDYPRQVALVKFIGTHREYDGIDAETI